MDEVLNPGQGKPKSSVVDFEIPFDVIDLPSKGILYNGTSLEGKDSLEVQYLTSTQEDILTSPNLFANGRLLEVLLRSVIKDKKVDPNELLLGDRNTILVWLRATGYGEDYPVTMECRKCGTEFEHTFDLSKLDTKEITETPDGEGMFSFTLPAVKKTIRFKLLNCIEEQEITKIAENNGGFAINKSGSVMLFQMIREIEGNTDRGYIKKFTESMLAKDARSFREYYSSLEPGIVMLQDATCTTCGNTSREVIPVRDNFFWPDS